MEGALYGPGVEVVTASHTISAAPSQFKASRTAIRPTNSIQTLVVAEVAWPVRRRLGPGSQSSIGIRKFETRERLK